MEDLAHVKILSKIDVSSLLDMWTDSNSRQKAAMYLIQRTIDKECTNFDIVVEKIKAYKN